MATVIDAFVVTFGIKPANPDGQKQVREDIKRTKDDAAAAAKDMEARGKQAAQFFGNLKTEVIGLFAAFTAGKGLQSFVRDTITADAATGRLAKNLNVATEELSAWQGVVKRTGGTAADADTSLQSLASALQSINLTGQSPLIPYLQNLGISLNDLKDPTETLLKIADKFHNMPAPRAFAMGQGMGFSPAMINVLEKGRGAVQQMLVEQVRLGVITKEDALAAQQLQDTLSQVAAASADMGRDLLTAAIPALEWLGRLLIKVSDWAKEHAGAVTGAFYGLAAGAAALTLALAPEVVLFGAIALAVAALGGAIGFLIDDFQKFQSGGPSSIDWGPFMSGIRAAQRGIQDVAAAFQQVAKAAKAAYDAIPPEVWKFLGDSLKATIGLALDLLTGSLHGVANGLKIVAGIIQLIVALLKGDWSGAWKAAAQVASDWFNGVKQQWADLKRAAIDYWATVTGQKHPTQPKPQPKPAPSAANSNNLGTFEGVKEFFRSKGWGEAKARGIAAGIAAENGRLDPNAVNPTSGAFGLGQHLGPRKKALFDRYGPNPTAQQQLEFLNWELNGGDRGGRAVKDAQGEQATLDAYISRFMRPAPGGETLGDMERGRRMLGANPASGAAVAAASAPARPSNDNRSTSTTEVHVGQVNIHTAATDAKGIAATIGPALRSRGIATQANTGLG